MNFYLHGGDVLQGLSINRVVSELRRRIAEEGYLQKLAQKYLRDNSKRVKIILRPEPKFQEILQQQELSKLRQVQSQLTAEQKQAIVAENQKLKEEQDQKQDPSVLPALKISDVPRHVEHTTFESVRHKGVDIHFTQQPTNGIIFLRLVVNVENLPPQIINQMGIITSIMSKSGTTTRTKEEINKQLNLYTTNFAIAHTCEGDIHNPGKPTQKLIIQIGFVKRNIKKALEILSDVLLSTLHSLLTLSSRLPFLRFDSPRRHPPHSISS